MSTQSRRSRQQHGRCAYTCTTRRHEFSPPMCQPCQELYAEWMDENIENLSLEKEHAAILKTKPATDREWREHCDQVAQVVNNSDPFTFTYSTTSLQDNSNGNAT